MTTETAGMGGTEVSLEHYSDDKPSECVLYSLVPETGDPTNEMVSIRIRETSPRDRQTDVSQRQTKKIVRRMQGFLIEIIGSEAKVAFVEGDAIHEYCLPANHLKEAGIRDENQPFQLDEVSMKTATGYMVGYDFQPLAEPQDVFQEGLTLDAVRLRKRDLIFKAFGHVVSTRQ